MAILNVWKTMLTAAAPLPPGHSNKGGGRGPHLHQHSSCTTHAADSDADSNTYTRRIISLDRGTRGGGGPPQSYDVGVPHAMHAKVGLRSGCPVTRQDFADDDPRRKNKTIYRPRSKKKRSHNTYTV